VHLLAVQHADGTVLPHPVAEPLSDALRAAPPWQGRQIGIAELQGLRPQPKHAPGLLDIAELFEREQEAARGRAVEAGGRGNVR
jgi:hypothetical protein